MKKEMKKPNIFLLTIIEMIEEYLRNQKIKNIDDFFKEQENKKKLGEDYLEVIE